jgi:hypothetical protein
MLYNFFLRSVKQRYTYLPNATRPMTSTKKQPLSKPLMVRVPQTMKDDLENVAAANDLSVSALIRVAVKKHLPAMKSGRGTLSPGT